MREDKSELREDRRETRDDRRERREMYRKQIKGRNKFLSAAFKHKGLTVQRIIFMITITVIIKISDIAVVLTYYYRSKGTDLEPITLYFDIIATQRILCTLKVISFEIVSRKFTP